MLFEKNWSNNYFATPNPNIVLTLSLAVAQSSYFWFSWEFRPSCSIPKPNREFHLRAPDTLQRRKCCDSVRTSITLGRPDRPDCASTDFPSRRAEARNSATRSGARLITTGAMTQHLVTHRPTPVNDEPWITSSWLTSHLQAARRGGRGWGHPLIDGSRAGAFPANTFHSLALGSRLKLCPDKPKPRNWDRKLGWIRGYCWVRLPRSRWVRCSVSVSRGKCRVPSATDRYRCWIIKDSWLNTAGS